MLTAAGPVALSSTEAGQSILWLGPRPDADDESAAPYGPEDVRHGGFSDRARGWASCPHTDTQVQQEWRRGKRERPERRSPRSMLYINSCIHVLSLKPLMLRSEIRHRL